MARLFGTDGVRGLANSPALTPELALAVARSAAQVIAPGPDPATGRRRTVVVGRDTRPSGDMLEGAVAAGFSSAGLDVLLAGVVPTPVVAYACASDLADLGLMISASHNPMPDNGLKLFGPGGHKLPDDIEDRIQAGLGQPDGQSDGQPDGQAGERPTGAAVGRIGRPGPELVEGYLDHLLGALEAPLAGLRVVVDCAEGAASRLAPELYRRAGAQVVAIHADGDGERINEGCGATHLESLQAAVRAHGADLGLAHDGDADRCLAVDGAGRVVDGDQILAICALGLQERGLLRTGTVVATVMSNLALHRAMAAAGITVVSAAVGDRYVLEQLRAGGHSLGGEQSGHLVFLDRATTGDGLLTGLMLLGRVAATRRSLAELASVVVPLPQILHNVRAPRDRAGAPDVVAAAAAEQAGLGEGGRVLLRASGTEELVRVMVEAPTEEAARQVAARLAAVVEAG